MSVSMSKRKVGNLPQDLSSFVGRRREVAETRRLLSTTRLLTLVGVGGVGKTRLALRVADEVQRAFPDGVWLVELAPVVNGEFVGRATAAALGLHDEFSRSPTDGLAEYLVDKQLLLVLDNCEHVVDAVADLVDTLLPVAPGIRVLATSRQLLRLDGEVVLSVPPLSVPVPNEYGSPSPRSEAVTLFAERAAASVAEFAITKENSTQVARLCQRLDGIPLAIELAAVRLRTLSVQEILDRLDDRFRLLTAGGRHVLPRQRTLRALIDWSYELCTEQERLLWARLSVFAGGCDLPAAEYVCGVDGISPGEVLELVADLIDRSVLVGETQHGGARYRLLETVRQYGREALAATGEESALRRRHSDWFRGLAAQAEAEWFGPGQAEWNTRLQAELADLRAALDFCVGQPGEARVALEIAAALWSHRLAWSSIGEGRHWLGRALALDQEPSSARAKALWVDGWLCLLHGDGAAARPLLAECRAVARRIGDESALVHAGQISGLAALFAGDFAGAEVQLEQAVAWYRQAGEVGHSWVALFQLAMAAVFGDRPHASELAQECLAMTEEHKAQWSRSYGLWIVAVDELRRGDPKRAVAAVQESLRIKRLFNDELGMAQCIEVLAWATAGVGRPERAARLLGSANMVWRRIGSALGGLEHLGGPHARYTSTLTGQLGSTAYAATLAEGDQFSLTQALRYALEEPEPAESEPAAPARRDGAGPLTSREWEVAELAAQGLSNKQIAGRLTISRRTADTHIEHILTKLGFASRTQIAAWVTEHREGGGRALQDRHRVDR
jgi:non-specific serine/threonine protein kinase